MLTSTRNLMEWLLPSQPTPVIISLNFESTPQSELYISILLSISIKIYPFTRKLPTSKEFRL